MPTNERIEGKVARILNERELVINRGSRDGVEIGMRFAILNPNGIDITDPETHEVLGSVPIAKTIVKVVRVDERMSVGRTFRTIPGRAGGSVFSAIAALSPIPDRPETLRAGERTVYQEISEEESSVKTGDPAIETRRDDEYTLPEH